MLVIRAASVASVAAYSVDMLPQVGRKRKEFNAPVSEKICIYNVH